jgi:thiosulfate/3-mercaptopyruvate sulfurtransferase
VSSVPAALAPQTFVPHVRAGMLRSVADVEAGKGLRLIDARSPERFRGENETLDKAAGHIPGAVNRFFQDNVRPDGTFKTPEELAAGWRDALGSATPDEAVCYCGSGVTACHNLLALEHAGVHGVKLYAGSWSEYSADAKRPIETGEAT